MKYGMALLEQLRKEKETIQQREKLALEKYIDCQGDAGDTFLTDRARTLTASLIDAKIRILENEGLCYFPALFSLNGSLVTSDLMTGQYGNFFIVDGKCISPLVREETLAKKGFRLGKVLRPAWVSFSGNTMLSVSIKTFKSEINYWTGEEV